METNNKYDNTNSGVLFKNENKQKMAGQKDTSKWPEYQGSLNADGKEYFMSAWVKKSRKDGTMFMSVSIKAKDEQPASSPGAQKQAPKPDSFDDDELPF